MVPFYTNVERTNKEVANTVLESILRDPIMDFMEQRNASIVEYNVANYGRTPVVELPEPREC